MRKSFALLAALVLSVGSAGCAADNADSGAQSQAEISATGDNGTVTVIPETVALTTEPLPPETTTKATTSAATLDAEALSSAWRKYYETTAPLATTRATTETEPEIDYGNAVDFIYDIPLYIEFESDFAEENYPAEGDIYYCALEKWYSPQNVIISYGGRRILDVRAYDIIYEDWDDESSYWLGEELFDIWGVHNGFTINYKTHLSEYLPERVIVLTDYDGNTHSYMISKNEDDTLRAEKVDIHKRKRGNDGVKHLLGDKKEITVRFYHNSDYYPSEEPELIYTTDTVSVENFADDVSEKMLLYSWIRIDDIWYEGTKLYVDLNVYEKYNFDRGSHAGNVSSANLRRTLSDFPGVEKVEILLDGERDAYADHFTFGEFEVKK